MPETHCVSSWLLIAVSHIINERVLCCGYLESWRLTFEIYFLAVDDQISCYDEAWYKNAAVYIRLLRNLWSFDIRFENKFDSSIVLENDVVIRKMISPWF